MDRMTPEERGRHMAKIKSKDTKPEIIVRKFLHANGFRYRLHDKSLPGRPDIKLTKYNTVIFVNGCFWHGHDGCKIYHKTKTNTDFWIEKIEGNKSRDEKKKAQLTALGWKVIVLWECQLNRKMLQQSLEYLIRKLRVYAGSFVEGDSI